MRYKNCKIVLGGQGGVGKTTIAQKLAGTLDLSEDRKMTPGIDFHQLEVSKENLLHAQLWDLGGQEQFRAFQCAFFESAHIVLLVFSVLRFPSYLSLESWFPLIKSDNLIQVYLIGNKIDDEPRVVTKEDAINIAVQNQMKYFEMSALTGLGFDEFRNDLVETIKNAFLSMEVEVEKKYLDITFRNGTEMNE